MKVTFCGATKTVTGSNFLVEGAGKKFLVDCGLYQGGAKDEIKNEEPFPYNINEIDFMLLTHAHIDHSGRIPKLYKEGYRNPIYATNATCDLCAIMLPDSGHIQETETEWKNRKRIRRGEEELVPIYDAETAAKSLELFKGEPYDQIIELDDDIHVRFNDAGHMLGSSTIEIWIRENGENKKIVFSGDLGNNDIPLLAEPTMIQDADFLVMESTYGNRLHIKNENKAKTFINIVTDTIKKMRRLSINLEKEENIIFSISNNCKKGLKRAKTIINFDYTDEFFEKFKVNRNAIIINLNDHELKLGNYYQGVIIENIEIAYNNNEKSNYNKTKLYESYICNLNYFSIQEKYNEDNCIISNLIGKNGFIQNRELKKVRTELDKLSKKD